MIIGISGKKQSGKDTFAKIANYHIHGGSKTFVALPEFLTYHDDGYTGSNRFSWEVKRFGDKLKAVVAILIGCTVEQLEDNKFKETPLGPEWDLASFCNDVECHNCGHFRDTLPEGILTPRRILQIMSTDCGRKMLHPNIWVNALMKDYRPYNQVYIGHGDHILEEVNWFITDVRMINEFNAVAPEGVNIRINRNKRPSEEWSKMFPNVIVRDPDGWDRRGDGWQHSWFEEYITLAEYVDRVMQSTCEFKTTKGTRRRRPSILDYLKPDTHESETALDNHTGFDAIIDNDGTLQEFSEKVKEVLINLNLLKDGTT